MIPTQGRRVSEHVDESKIRRGFDLRPTSEGDEVPGVFEMLDIVLDHRLEGIESALRDTTGADAIAEGLGEVAAAIRDLAGALREGRK